MKDEIAAEFTEVFSNDKEMQEFLTITNMVNNYFENIRNKLPFQPKDLDKVYERPDLQTNNYKRTHFIIDIIGDFLWDLIEEVKSNCKHELDYYWEGQSNLYLSQLKQYKEDATNIIIQLFIFYEVNKQDFKSLTFNEIDDESSEYYRGYFGGNLGYLPNKKELLSKLSIKSKKILNKYLSACDLKLID